MEGSVRKCSCSEFLKLSESQPVVDVRSPSEYFYGHIPGAVNIPLFDDSERDIVGKTYKQKGRIPAIIKGIELTGPTFSSRLKSATEVAVNGKLLVHCWRGGMRSETMAWLFSLADIECTVLEGGYKSYRNHVLDDLGKKREFVILGGLTGSGKTEILYKLKESGEQIVDLEQLANHRGSSFGSLGQPPQPSSEHFANLLHKELSYLDTSRRIWLEDESKNIGSVFMPDEFFNRMREAPVIALMMEIKTRLPRLVKEYAAFPTESLQAAVNRISKRLGGDMTHEALESIDSGNFERAIEITLAYYDKTYQFGIKKRSPETVKSVSSDSDDASVNARMILSAAEDFLKERRF